MKNNKKSMLKCFGAVIDSKISVLVLGSMPGNKSLEASQYYAHPRNALWPILADIIGFEVSLPYEERLNILLNNHIGLWDVIAQCNRIGSLDSNIVAETIECNDFNLVFRQCMRLEKILFNGKKAYELFHRLVLVKPETEQFIQDKQIDLILLPSTSPANAMLGYQQKLEVWKKVF